MSNAERQARYRERKRNTEQGGGVTAVTPEQPTGVTPGLTVAGLVKIRDRLLDLTALSDVELQIRLKSYQGASWVNSPEHKEVQRRRGSNEQALQAAGAALTAAPVNERTPKAGTTQEKALTDKEGGGGGGAWG